MRRIRMRVAIRSERGQILPLFALTVVALFAMAALLFDAAQALVVRRQLQDATDAAALAAANVIQSGSPRGCSTTAGPPPGAPRTAVADAARASLTANLSATLAAAATITCPAGSWENTAVRVELTNTAPSFFAAFLGRAAFTVSTRSTAVNGYGNGLGFSVITLNPYVPSYGVNTRGCPSMIFAGAPRVHFEGNVQINSACPRTDSAGPALQMSGTASQVTFANGAQAFVTGEADDTSRAYLLPAPVEGAPPVPDPLANLPPVDTTALTVRSATRLVLNGGSQSRVLDPGIYTGGIELRSTARVYLRPGIYVLNGGGFDIGSQASVFTVRQGHTSTTTTSTTWATTDCPVTTCGAFIYNKADALGAMGQFFVNAGAVVRLRPYRYELDPTNAARIQYTGIALWQDRIPTLSQSYQQQPEVRLVGGAAVTLGGTIYAPNARVNLGGGSGGGSGTYDLDYALQFVAKDVQFSGTAYWRMQYSDATFVRPPDYGLVE